MTGGVTGRACDYEGPQDADRLGLMVALIIKVNHRATGPLCPEALRGYTRSNPHTAITAATQSITTGRRIMGCEGGNAEVLNENSFWQGTPLRCRQMTLTVRLRGAV